MHTFSLTTAHGDMDDAMSGDGGRGAGMGDRPECPFRISSRSTLVYSLSGKRLLKRTNCAHTEYFLYIKYTMDDDGMLLKMFFAYSTVL